MILTRRHILAGAAATVATAALPAVATAKVADSVIIDGAPLFASSGLGPLALREMLWQVEKALIIDGEAFIKTGKKVHRLVWTTEPGQRRARNPWEFMHQIDTVA